jgi:hypothetical protein
MDSLESLTSLRIDRYVAIEEDAFKDYIQNSKIRSRVVGEYRNYKKDDVIGGQDLIDYLYNQEEYEVERFVKLIDFNLERNTNYVSYLRFFFESSDLDDVFQTDFSKGELFDFFFALLEGEYPAITSQLDESQGYIYADGLEEGIISNELLVDEVIAAIFVDLEILTEQARIEVFNAAGVNGLASKVKRNLENQGANIVKYGNYNQNLEDSIVYVLNKDIDAFDKTLKAIRRLIGTKNLEIQTDGYEGNYTGDIVLILGKDTRY